MQYPCAVNWERPCKSPIHGSLSDTWFVLGYFIHSRTLGSCSDILGSLSDAWFVVGHLVRSRTLGSFSDTWFVLGYLVRCRILGSFSDTWFVVGHLVRSRTLGSFSDLTASSIERDFTSGQVKHSNSPHSGPKYKPPYRTGLHLGTSQAFKLPPYRSETQATISNGTSPRDKSSIQTPPIPVRNTSHHALTTKLRLTARLWTLHRPQKTSPSPNSELLAYFNSHGLFIYNWSEVL